MNNTRTLLRANCAILIWALVATLGLSSCADTASKSRLDSAQEPHVPGTGILSGGPWFEGWYARVTDAGGQRSVAVIVGSHKPAGQPPSAADAGYIGVLVSEGNGSPTQSWTFFPTHTRTLVDNQPVTHNPDITSRADRPFVWQADGYGTFANDRVHISVPGQVEVDMDFGPPKDWNAQGWPLGPEGYLAPLPVPLHWYVKSLNSPATYHVRMYQPSGASVDLAGTGHAHLEKNWGTVFPKAWNWLQGQSTDEDAQLVLGGGTVGFGPVNLKAWLAGYRSPNEAWDIRFSDPLTKISVDQESCSGLFHLNASRPGLEVDVHASADPASFGSVAVPTAIGFVADDGAESFSARLEVSTYRIGLRGKYLSDYRVFTNAALEFGAGSYCRPDRSHGEQL